MKLHIFHDWTRWGFITTLKLSQYRFCLKCGKQQRRTV